MESSSILMSCMLVLVDIPPIVTKRSSHLSLNIGSMLSGIWPDYKSHHGTPKCITVAFNLAIHIRIHQWVA